MRVWRAARSASDIARDWRRQLYGDELSLILVIIIFFECYFIFILLFSAKFFLYLLTFFVPSTVHVFFIDIFLLFVVS